MAVPIKGRTQAQPAQDAQPELPSRRLAAIMFTDLVGYSALAHRDEALAIELLELHRGWVREILPRYSGQEIETVGDAFLIVFAGALSAVECAIALQERFAEHNRTEPSARHMKLRIGIHLGDIEHRAGKVMGDGVNVASRIHGMAQPGGICVSEDVQRLVRNRAGLRFTSLGTPDLKNISTRLELYAVHAGRDSLRQEVVAKARRVAGRFPRWLMYPMIAVAMVAIFSDDDEDLARITLEPGSGVPAQPGVPATVGRPVVMVPPFDGPEADTAIAAGLHRAVIEQLQAVGGIEVVSIASALNDPMGEFRKISGDRGLSHVMVATVARAGERLRITVQLLDAKNDAIVWNSEYERDLGDAAAAQADVARSIAAAVRSKLVPPG